MRRTTHDTRQRRAVRAALTLQGGFVTAQELHAALRAEGDPIGLTTVYRALQALAEAGDVDVLRGGAEAAYRLCGAQPHHHHLVCESCGRTVEVEADAVEHWARRVASDHGFTHSGHTVELFGRCPDCAGSSPAQPG